MAKKINAKLIMELRDAVYHMVYPDKIAVETLYAQPDPLPQEYVPYWA